MLVLQEPQRPSEEVLMAAAEHDSLDEAPIAGSGGAATLSLVRRNDRGMELELEKLQKW